MAAGEPIHFICLPGLIMNSALNSRVWLAGHSQTAIIIYTQQPDAFSTDEA